MQTGEFVAAFREAFGPVPELPLLFRYTDEPLRPAAKAGGCFFKALAEARDGRPVGLNASNIGCGGGKFYTGFSPMPEFVPQFVSLKERYKQTPEMVLDFIAALDLRPGPKAWLEFVTWAGFDNDAPDAVAAPFGSGCSTVVSQAVRENRNGGHRCFLGLFHPSVRPWVGADELCFVIPMSRFAGMCGTMRASCLFGTHAWDKVRERINKMNL